MSSSSVFLALSASHHPWRLSVSSPLESLLHSPQSFVQLKNQRIAFLHYNVWLQSIPIATYVATKTAFANLPIRVYYWELLSALPHCWWYAAETIINESTCWNVRNLKLDRVLPRLLVRYIRRHRYGTVFLDMCASGAVGFGGLCILCFPFWWSIVQGNLDALIGESVSKQKDCVLPRLLVRYIRWYRYRTGPCILMPCWTVLKLYPGCSFFPSATCVCVVLYNIQVLLVLQAWLNLHLNCVYGRVAFLMYFDGLNYLILCSPELLGCRVCRCM